MMFASVPSATARRFQSKDFSNISGVNCPNAKGFHHACLVPLAASAGACMAAKPARSVKIVKSFAPSMFKSGPNVLRPCSSPSASNALTMKMPGMSRSNANTLRLTSPSRSIVAIASATSRSFVAGIIMEPPQIVCGYWRARSFSLVTTVNRIMHQQTIDEECACSFRAVSTHLLSLDAHLSNPREDLVLWMPRQRNRQV